MPKHFLRLPDEARNLLARRYRNAHRNWLAEDGGWPLAIPLGCPSEEQARELGGAIGEWVDAWRRWSGPGDVVWSDRRWRTLGTQRLPERLVVASAVDAACLAGEERQWMPASSHYRHLVGRWPALASRLTRWFEALADLDDRDIAAFEELLLWLERNPRSGLYPRQLPIPGMDTKWMERRLPMAADLLASLRGEEVGGRTVYQVCGLREAPNTVRMRILDPSLRARFGGLGDITAPVGELRGIRHPVDRVFIVENLQTGLAFEDRPGSVVVMGLGYGVTGLAGIPWIAESACIYWGDLDTHGFAILNRARSCLGRVASALMTEAALLRYRSLWAREIEQCADPDLPNLTESERTLYRDLKEQRWGINVRLEQERIAWDEAVAALDDVAAGL